MLFSWEVSMEMDASRRSEDMVLRESLAVERTCLANERTLLAYARTSLAFFAAGLTGAHLLEDGLWRILSWIFVAVGPLIALVGVVRFFRARRAIRRDSSNSGRRI